MEDELLTRDDVAKLLKISLVTIYRLTKEGELPAVRGKRFVRYRRSDVEDFINRHITYGQQQVEGD